MRLSSPVVFLLLLTTPLSCRVAKPPAESPTRILSLDRALPVMVVSHPPGVAVYRSIAGREPALLGRTPVIIDRLRVTKEMWKHGAERPPPSGAGFELNRGGDGIERRIGEALVWTVLLRGDDGHFREVVFHLAPEGLTDAYTQGRLELTLPQGTR